MKEFEHLRVPLDFIKHATNNFGATNFIAEGGFGRVYKGEFQGEVFFHSHGRNIGAVKILDRSKDQADVSFWREIMLLSSYRHENLISLLGFCDERDKRIIVYEYASNKSLDFHLCSPDLTWLQRLKICLGAACGLQYLHDPRGTQQRVLHRDIKSANILLDENWNAKIADFGLSKHGPANQQYTFLFSEAKGTLGYCDPMYLETMLLTKESDVYSFGVVLFEVLCSRHCVDYSYNDERRSLPVLVKKCYREKSLHTIIDVNLKQQIKEKSLDTFVTLAYQCLERDRTQRPSMEMVVSMLESALKHQVNYSFSSSENEIRGGAIGNVTTTESHSYGKRTFPWNFLNFAGGQSSHGTGKGRGHQGSVKFGFNLAKGKANHPMEDYHVAKFIPYQGIELGLFAIYDGHLGDSVAVYLQKHLFSNILKEGEFWTDPCRAILKAYERTDQSILSHSPDLGRGGSTAVTALLIGGRTLWIANVGDSRAVLSKRGKAIQMSVDHEPNTERGSIENRGGFVSNMPGDVARVNGQLAVSRAFGDKNLKAHLRSDPDVTNADIDATTEILILASDGLWKVMSNQEAVDIAIKIKDPLKGAKELVAEALKRESKDDISCIVVHF